MKNVKLAVLYGARALGLFWLARILSRSKLRILCYHGGNFHDEYLFNPLLFSNGKLLDSRIRWLLIRGFSIITLDQAISMASAGGQRVSLPTVLTFDDGWYSTFSCFHPIVVKYQVPATLYLSTKYYSSGLPVLDVVLRYMLWKSGKRQFVLSGLDPIVDGVYDNAKPDFDVVFVKKIINWIESKGCGRDRVCLVLESLAVALGVSTVDLNLQSRRFDFVGGLELAKMSSEGWAVELHGHVHQYPSGKPDVLKDDIAACRQEITKAGLPAAKHYCYPSGSYDSEAHQLLESLDVISATTCKPSLIGELDNRNRYYLGRFLDGEKIHQLEFESEMSGFSDWLRVIWRKA